MSCKLAGAGEVGRRVDLHAETAGLDQTDRDPHAGLEGAQLLEVLSLFDRKSGILMSRMEAASPGTVPMLASGKVDKVALRRLLGAARPTG